jgi:hypothetical protein
MLEIANVYTVYDKSKGNVNYFGKISLASTGLTKPIQYNTMTYVEQKVFNATLPKTYL